MHTTVLAAGIKFSCKLESLCSESAYGLQGKFEQYQMLITASSNYRGWEVGKHLKSES